MSFFSHCSGLLGTIMRFWAELGAANCPEPVSDVMRPYTARHSTAPSPPRNRPEER